MGERRQRKRMNKDEGGQLKGGREGERAERKIINEEERQGRSVERRLACYRRDTRPEQRERGTRE